jgi:DNA-binding transcriptional LysR family regulator
MGCEISLWDPLLLRWLLWMRAADPDLALRTEVGEQPDLLDKVASGVLDIAVAYAPQQRPGLRVELLIEEKLVMVTTAKRPRVPRPADYAGVSLPGLCGLCGGRRSAHRRARAGGPAAGDARGAPIDPVPCFPSKLTGVKGRPGRFIDIASVMNPQTTPRHHAAAEAAEARSSACANGFIPRINWTGLAAFPTLTGHPPVYPR